MGFKVFNSKLSPRAVAIVVHGLNNNPSTMNFLISELNRNQISVVRVSLSGHAERDGQNVSLDMWLQDILEAYRFAKREFSTIPIYLVGFSIGAALGIFAIDKYTEMQIAKGLFIAPAISISWKAFLIRILQPLSKLRLFIPTLMPAQYRCHTFIPLAWYVNLLNLIDKLEVIQFQEKLAGLSAVVLLNKEDKLVSYNGVLKWIYNKNCPWKVQEINPVCNLKRNFGHILIDPYGLGDEGWCDLSQLVSSFF